MSNTHQPRRLDSDGAPIRLTAHLLIDGRPIEAREGEPVAVALLAAGIRVFRTMPESGEPRGGFCFTGRCADCLMIVDGVSGVRTCTTLVRDGMTVETQQGLGRPIPETDR